MMRPLRLELRNFRGWREGAVPLDRQVTVLLGDNRRGKSSTLNAIEWCLYGREIEKKASGIAERAEWEVERRGAEELVEVGLALEIDGEPARIVRRRKAGAGAREEDELAVEVGGAQLDGDQARAWMRERRLPDWETWRRACCQHQEVLRGRLTVAEDRSQIVAALLGMDEYDRLQRVLKDQQPGKLIGELDRELGELDKVVLYRLRAPSEELYECERKLEALGIERARLSPALAAEIARAAIERARGLAERLEIEPRFPALEGDADDPALRKWAEGWPARVRKESRTHERLASATKRRVKLAAEIEQLEPSEARWREVKGRLERERAERGDEAAQQRALAESARRAEQAEAALRAEDRTLALLREALEVLRHDAEGERCPVCASDVPGLAERIEARVRAASGERSAALGVERDQARARREALERSIHTLERLAADERESRQAFEGRRASLVALVAPARLEGGADLLAAARAEEDALAGEISRLEAALAGFEAELEEHRKDAERLREIFKWRAAARRAQERADLTASPEWRSFQAAVDATAAYAADLDVLGAMAREAQEERSQAREDEVNRALGEYCALIAGREACLDPRVRVKRTPKGLTYEIEDAGGGRALSILNQASLNAISLSLLFAQAEERARGGLPQMLVLDDPGQSLDEDYAAGLARAIERVARHCAVIVGTTPGKLAERLVSHVSHPRRILRLAPPPVGERLGDGVRIESQEER